MASTQKPYRPKAPQLTCETCKRRKVKCDKLRPCSSCQSSGNVCVPVQRARLPRGRAARKSGHREDGPNLTGRISRLEQRLQSLLDEYQVSSSPGLGPGSGGTEAGAEAEAEAEPDRVGCEIVLSARSTGSTADDDDFTLYYLDPVGESTRNLYFDGRGVGRSRCCDPRLLDIFLERVNPILPILHQPSLGALVSGTGVSRDYEPDHPAPLALAAAISYIAISSMSNIECLQMFRIEKSVALKEYSATTLHALEEADYMSTDDLTVLQAFVLFLFSLRTHDSSRRSWTMVSLAVRIAQSLSLNDSNPPFIALTPLESELRTRLWHAISLLDVQAAFDYGSEPLLPWNCLLSQTPTTMSSPDQLLPWPSDSPRPPSTFPSHSDIRFTLVIEKSSRTFRTLNTHQTQTLPINHRKNIASTFRTEALALLSTYPDSEFHWFLRKITEIIHAFLQLLALRPLRASPGFLPPQVVPQGGLLVLILNFLEALKQFYLDQRSERYGWYTRLYPPWHALGVAVEQVSGPEREELRRGYWPLIEGYMEFFREFLSEAHHKHLRSVLSRVG